jgi:hypothetical protein
MGFLGCKGYSGPINAREINVVEEVCHGIEVDRRGEIVVDEMDEGMAILIS